MRTIRTDGGDERALRVQGTVRGRAAWSPDGAYVALAADNGEDADIFVLALARDGMPLGQHNLTRSRNLSESDPAWSRDQQKLAYVATQTSYWAVYVMEVRLSASNAEPVIMSDRRVSSLSNSLRYKGNPAWSPDGARVAYTSDVGNRWDLVSVIPYEPETVRQPGTALNVAGTNYPASAMGLSWSPSGEDFVFAANAWGDWDLYVARADGTAHRRLTQHSADDWNPAWSPDGGWIAFTSNRTGASDLYLISSDGAAIAQLTTTPESEDFASWIPLGHPGGELTP